MNFLRKRFVCRVIAITLLITILQSTLLPYYGFALTSGSHQPEYTSYEDAGSTDMVNLMTGDFGFNIPLLEVPGPEGNFAIPLSYHAGIGLEQEASWVGLGWNINAGAINRDINQYPDDASGEPHYVTVQNLTGVTGWNRKFNHPFKDDWNSQTGYHGNVNLLDIVEVDFGNRTNVGIVGVHVGDGHVTFNPVQFTMALITILSYGTGGIASSAASVAKQAAIDMAISTAVSFAMPVNSPTAPTAGNWKTTKSSKTNFGVDWIASGVVTLGITAGWVLPIVHRTKSYHIWLDKTRAENMYGLLNLGNAPLNLYGDGKNAVSIINGVSKPLNFFPHSTETVDRGSASDINFTMDDGLEYYQQSFPTLLASDTYTVSAAGIGGNIKPFRLDVGSVGMPMELGSYHKRFSPLPYLNNYQVPFIYEGSIFNQYFYNSGSSPSSTPLNPSFYFGLNCVSNTTLNFNLDDKIFGNRIRQDLADIGKLPQGTDIAWLSNSTIRDQHGEGSIATPLGFVDCFKSDVQNSNSDRYKFRTTGSVTNSSIFKTTFNDLVAISSQSSGPNYKYKIAVKDKAFLAQLSTGDVIDLSIAPMSATCSMVSKDDNSITISTSSNLSTFANGLLQNITLNYTIPPVLDKKIGGYKITAMDGTSYHFAIPIYGYDESSESISIADATKKSILNRYAAFANSWLLTAVTGPDYVDRNANGLADDGDWGYWVKMNYGNYCDDFEWRIPFTGTMNDATNTYTSYERGKKQLYYLNSIETRSHVALFMKSVRQDGYDAKMHISTLKLDEIYLLKKEHYKKMFNAPYSIADYSNTISRLCMSSQYINQSRDYINKNCLKRIVFNYSYDLCKGTPNTDINNNPQKGKLTLTGITIKGRNDLKIAPDFKFEYANNPSYSSNSWDGWGMYNVAGGHTTNDPTGSSGSAWSLTKVINPLGSEISVNYERDTYGSISGESVDPTESYSYDPVNAYVGSGSNITMLPVPSSIAQSLKIGDVVSISGTISYTCGSFSGLKTYPLNRFSITSVNTSSNQVLLSSAYANLTGCEGVMPVMVTNNSGTLQKIIQNKSGGDIRVASIAIRDEFGKENRLRYLYNNDDGTSSGVVSQEPDFIKVVDYPFYNYLKYPRTPVMYGRVSVLSGKLSNDTDFYSKQIFEFETPHKTQYSYSSEDRGTVSGLIQKFFKFEDSTSKIGKLKSVKILDHAGAVSSTSALSYTKDISNNNINNYQGVFVEGNILAEHIDNIGDRLFRTTAISYPYVLKKIENTKDGFTSSSENLNWDLLTGAVTGKLDKSSLGVYIKSVVKPAYTIPAYSELGSKAIDGNNKNMLSQIAATYSYRSDAAGSELGLISADVQTWRNNWDNYRTYSNASYIDEGAQTNKIWRKGPAYVWKGSYDKMQTGFGTQDFITANDFNFASGATNSLWQYLGEMKRFDHYGMPLESVDFNNIYSTTKMGYDNRTIIASAGNAQYNEIAFSSAEDKVMDSAVPANTYFGGEVAFGAGTIVSTPVHTGNTALSVVSGTAKYGFVFKSTEISTTKSYRASVWSNSTNGRIYYKLNNGTEVIPTPVISTAVAIPGMGNWYRIDIAFTPTSPVLEIGVKSQSGTVVFDDFRFQPANAVMQCYVYPPLDFEFTATSPTYSSFSYVLDNDNLFTKYETNEKGELVKVYSESITYGVKLISESKNNLRRFNIDQ